MDEWKDFLGDDEAVSNLEVNSGYWQIRINQPELAKSVFTSREEIYQFTHSLVRLKSFNSMTDQRSK